MIKNGRMMIWAEHAWWGKRNVYIFWVGKPKEGDHFEVIEVDGKML
jgi:hypothetical protein